jgi:hypothetical protein
VRTEEVLHGVKKDTNILNTITRKNGNWIGHILCRNSLLKHAIEGKMVGKIEVTERRKPQMDDLEEKRGNVN